MRLNEEQIQAYYHRSYTAVDGLWFMKVEDKYGFEKALEMDNSVWQIMPKIQARMLKSMLNCGENIDGLKECFQIKLDLEGFKYSMENRCNGFSMVINRCPWYDLLVKSNRSHLAEKVGTCICNSEYAAFAREFGNNIGFTIGEQLCAGTETCVLDFQVITTL